MTATRLPQNAPNRMWNSKNFQGVIPRDPVPYWGSAKVATLLMTDHDTQAEEVVTIVVVRHLALNSFKK